MIWVNLVLLLFCIKDSYSRTKIIGGAPVVEYKYPFIVCIKYWKCGGTLIKEDVVLTAAHCFFNNNNEMFWASSLEAYGGSVDLNRAEEHHIGYHLIAHPKFSHTVWSGYDCGVMELRSEFNLNLAHVGYEIEVYQWDFTSLRKITNDMIIHGEDCWSIGWGAQQINNGDVENFSYVLNEFKSNIISCEQYELESSFGISSHALKNQAMLCTTDKTGNKKSNCNGDSGSPLICDCVVVGLLSYGATGHCGQDGAPSFYTRIDLIEDFLKPYTFEIFDTDLSTASPHGIFDSYNRVPITIFIIALSENTLFGY